MELRMAGVRVLGAEASRCGKEEQAPLGWAGGGGLETILELFCPWGLKLGCQS